MIRIRHWTTCGQVSYGLLYVRYLVKKICDVVLVQLVIPACDAESDVYLRLILVTDYSSVFMSCNDFKRLSNGL